MNKLRLLVFHPCLAPYRVDQFNHIGRQFQLFVVFLFDNVWNHPFDQGPLLFRLRVRYTHLLKGPCYKGRVFRWGMLKVIRQELPDVVLGYEFSFTTLYLIVLKYLGLVRCKIGSTIDDSPAICENVQSLARRISRRFIVRRLDYLIVLSEEVASFYSTNFSFPREKIIVSPLLQDPESLRATDGLETIAQSYSDQFQLVGKKNILFVGRLIPEKGLFEFLLCINEILKTATNVNVIIVGDGVERGRLQELILKLDLSSKVKLTGRFEGPSLLAWYLCASGFVLPSIFEPFGAVVNEALIFGLPVACSNRAGSSFLVKESNGIIFNPTDSKDVKSSFLKLLDLVEPLKEIRLGAKRSLLSWDSFSFSTEWSKVNRL